MGRGGVQRRSRKEALTRSGGGVVGCWITKAGPQPAGYTMAKRQQDGVGSPPAMLLGGENPWGEFLAVRWGVGVGLQGSYLNSGGQRPWGPPQLGLQV